MMASYTEQAYEDASDSDIADLMLHKAHELFNVCDVEEKGFITKRDMQRLQAQLPLSPEQLEDVFDSLDDDGNGFLTLEEFTEGFGSFLGIGPAPAGVQKQESVNSAGSEKVYENDHYDSENEEEHFSDMMDNLGANGIFDDVDVLRSLWVRLRRDEPHLLGNFESFLARVSGEIKRSYTDLQSLESALRNKATNHDDEVRKLYDEMEQQIRLEKDRVIAEERAREKVLREEMERELREKEAQLHEISNRSMEIETKLSSLSSTETEVKAENERLAREKEDLENLLDQTQRHLEESKGYIHQLRQKQRDEKKDRAMAALSISEGIAMERESLVKQLDMLRDMNKKLRDERDIADMQRAGEKAPNLYRNNSTESNNNTKSFAETEQQDQRDHLDSGSRSASTDNSTPDASERRKQLSKQGSILSNYFDSRQSHYGSSLQPSYEEDIEVDEPVEYYQSNQQYSSHIRPGDEVEVESEISAAVHSNLSASPSGMSRMRGASLAGSKHMSSFMQSIDDTNMEEQIRDNIPAGQSSPVNELDGPRGQPVGASASTDFPELAAIPTVPERVFKVVFVGDSGVGKSSFIHRFCNDTFKATFSATIGVDFQVRSMMVESHLIALQLWDTAGQERFRSITKQYFRKADGVIVMYDVTSESSFMNVRNWMQSVQDGCEEGTVIALLGNKIDLSEDDEQRAVKTKDGARLSDDFGTLFFETSAKSGNGVTESMTGMASLLREREDREMEKALSLTDDEPAKKKSCCN